MIVLNLIYHLSKSLASVWIFWLFSTRGEYSSNFVGVLSIQLNGEILVRRHLLIFKSKKKCLVGHKFASF